MGLPKKSAMRHATSLRKMEHTICTGFVISKNSINWGNRSNLEERDRTKMLRRGGDSCKNRMILIWVTNVKATGQKVDCSDPNSTLKIKKWLIGFVDDNTFLIKLDDLGFDASVDRLP